MSGAKAAKGGKVWQSGVIDVGAHSVRLDLFEVARDGRTTLLESLARGVNLGNDVFRYGAVSPANLELLGGVLEDFARKLAEYRIRDCRVVATSAIREAFNRELVVNRVRNDAHLELEILEEPEEIRISFLSMRDTLSRHFAFEKLSGIGLVVGTGSLLVIYFENGLMRFSEGVQLGTARLEDAFGRGAVSTAQILESLRSQDLRTRLAECIGGYSGAPLTLVAMGASVRLLAGMGTQELIGGEDSIAVMKRDRIREITGRVQNLDGVTLGGELQVPEAVGNGVAACAVIVGYFMEEFDCDRFVCPGTTTRSALISDMVRRRRSERDPFYPDMLAICDSIGHKYGYDQLHAEQVSQIGFKLIAKLRRTFDFTARAPMLFEAAARLHDIGRFVDTRQHHKHSWYLISNMQLPGISDREQRIVAAVSRYHRKSHPKESHPEYLALPAEDKVTVLKLAAVLRVADSLDASRCGRFKKFKTALRGHVLTLIVPPNSGDMRVERFYLEQKGMMFNEVFGLEIRIEEGVM